MDEKKIDQEPKHKGGTLNQAALYQKVASREEDILNALFESLSSRNEPIRISAAKTLLNKILPDLKSIELGGEMGIDGKRRAIELLVNLGRGFIPPTITIPSTSDGSTTAVSTTLQSSGVAPQSEENMDSSDGNSEASPR